MEDSYIRFESTLQQPQGDSSTVDYKFSLDKVFCAEEFVIFLKGFLEGTFEEEFIEEIVENFDKDFDDLLEGVDIFYKELEEDVQSNPEKYSTSKEEFLAIKEIIEARDRKNETVEDISDVQEFKNQLDKNPKFLKKVFKGYIDEILKD